MTAHPLIKRAARTLCMEGCRGECPGGSCGANWRDEIQPARTVVLDLLAALEEPSEAMLKAGEWPMIPMPLGNGQTIQVPGLGASPGASWRAMLAALRTEITAQGGGK